MFDLIYHEKRKNLKFKTDTSEISEDFKKQHVSTTQVQQAIVFISMCLSHKNYLKNTVFIQLSCSIKEHRRRSCLSQISTFSFKVWTCQILASYIKYSVQYFFFKGPSVHECQEGLGQLTADSEEEQVEDLRWTSRPIDRGSDGGADQLQARQQMEAPISCRPIEETHSDIQQLIRHRAFPNAAQSSRLRS